MKKVLAAFLACLLAFSGVVGAYAATFSDTVNHWATKEIEYMVSKSVINGRPDGTFDPENKVTRVEFIKMICETFGLTETANINYSDVSASQWFYPYVRKAAAQGFLLNYGSSLNPDGALSRQEACALLVRYLGLDPDHKADASAYPDYNQIKTAYRDYVLQATYEGLFRGRDNGCFDPDATLKRSEALAILYRAAGTIYRASATGTDTAANNENAVVSAAGITVSNAIVEGRLLITEGAADGVITLSTSEIDEVVLRGTASLIVFDGMIKHLIVDVDDIQHVAEISLLGSATIGEVTFRTPASMSMASKTIVGELDVEADAANSSVTGSGKVNAANIAANKFTAEKVPEKYTLAAGISAVLGGTTYTGSGTVGASSAFSVLPTTYGSASACYLTATTKVTGKLFCYFSATATPPTAAAFAMNYTSASQKITLDVTANVSMDKSIASSALVSAYPYVVVMLTGADGTTYEPVVVVNRASNGFATTPTVSSVSGYDSLNYTANTTGTIYYYYTNTNTALTVTAFTTGYQSATARGTVPNITANQNLSATLLSQLAAPVSTYGYIAMMILDNTGESFMPVVISRSSSSATLTGTGFVSNPVVVANEADNGVKVVFVTAGAGKVQYYLSETDTVPTSAQFDAGYAQYNTTATAGLYRGETTTSANTPNSFNVSAYALLANKKYAVIRYTASNGTKYAPIVVKLTVSNNTVTDAEGSGMTGTPVVSLGGDGKMTVALRTTAETRVYYYLTNTATPAATSDVFLMNYKSATNSAANPTGGVLTATGIAQTLATVLPNEYAKTFKYMAILVRENITLTGETYYKPILVTLPTYTDVTTPTSAENGLADTPVYSQSLSSVHQLQFTPSVSGTAYFVYTDSSTIPAVPDIDISLMDRETITAGTKANLTLWLTDTDSSGKLVPKNYVLVMIKGTDGTYYKPFLVPTGSSTVNIGFVTTPTAPVTASGTSLSYNVPNAGNIYYIISSTSADLPTTLTDFIAKYEVAADGKHGSLTANRGASTQLISSTITSGYVAVMYVDYAGENYTPVVIKIGASAGSGTGTGTGTGTASGSGFTETPKVSAISGLGTYLSYKISTDGALYYYMTNTLSAPTTSAAFIAAYEMASEKGIKQIAAANNILSLSSTVDYAYIVIMYVSDSTMYTPVALAVNGTGSTAGSYGFSSLPQLILSGYVQFTPSVSGKLYYFTTDATTSILTSSEFISSAFSSNDFNNVSVTSGTTGSITLSGTYGKYLWVMIKKADDTFTTPYKISVK